MSPTALMFIFLCFFLSSSVFHSCLLLLYFYCFVRSTSLNHGLLCYSYFNVRFIFLFLIFWAEHYKECHLGRIWLNIYHSNHLVTAYKCKTCNYYRVVWMIWRASECFVCSDYGEGSCPVSVTSVPADPSGGYSEWLSIHVWLKTDGTQSNYTVCKHPTKCHI